MSTRKRNLLQVTVLAGFLLAMGGAVDHFLFAPPTNVAAADTCSCSAEPPTEVAGIQISDVLGIPRRDIEPGTYEVIPAGDKGTEVLLFLRKPDADSEVWCQSLPSSTFIVEDWAPGRQGILNIVQDRTFKIARFSPADP
jgi:hypothetical protein